MLIKKIFRVVGVSLNVGFGIVAVLLALSVLYYFYVIGGRGINGLTIMIGFGGGAVIVGLIKGFFELLAWFGQPSKNDDEDDDDYY